MSRCFFVGRINGENAGTYASEVMYLATSLLTGQQEYVRRYVSAYALIFRIISVYERHPRQCIGIDMLQKAGLFLSERHGKWTYYRRNEEMLAALSDYFGHEI